MGQRIQAFFGNRIPNRVEHLNAMVPRQEFSARNALEQARRGVPRNEQLPFVPPENWHEPQDSHDNYRVIVQSPGAGHRHILTPDDIRQRLAQLARAIRSAARSRAVQPHDAQEAQLPLLRHAMGLHHLLVSRGRQPG